MIRTLVRAAGIGCLLAFGGGAASAAVVTADFSGNDCAGYFGGTGPGGGGFDACTVFVNSDGVKIELSPVIAKYDVPDEGSNAGQLPATASDTNNTDYPTIAGDEFSFSNLTADNKTGTWDYTMGAGDPGVKYWATKAGNAFRLFWQIADADSSATCQDSNSGSTNYNLSCLLLAQTVVSGDWTTPDNKELSHITFYNTEPPTEVIPLPASALLLLGGIGGFGALRTLRRKA